MPPTRPMVFVRGCLLLATLLLQVGCGCANGPTETVEIKGEAFTLEVVTTRAAIEKGLGGRESIPENGGMLFVFPDVKARRFWMVECLVDIDIMYLDALGRITAIHTMPPEELRGEDESLLDYESRLPGYSSSYPAQFAIELIPGSFESLGIEVGDRVSIPPERLKTLGKAAEPD